MAGKRLCWRKVPFDISSPIRFELTRGGEEVGYISRTAAGYTWVVFGDRLGIPTMNSLWGSHGGFKAYQDADSAKTECVAWVKKRLAEKLNEDKK